MCNTEDPMVQLFGTWYLYKKYNRYQKKLFKSKGEAGAGQVVREKKMRKKGKIETKLYK